MYEQRFGLQRRPFPPTPDTALYYPATTHEAALDTVQRGLDQDEGLIALTGLPGTGKTLLGYTLLERLPPEYGSAFVTNSHIPDRTALLQAILFDLAQPYEASEQILRLRLIDTLLQTCADGRRTILIVDEAQHLSPDLLEELRLLGNLEAGSGKAVQVVLLAQSGLLTTLQLPELAALQQRLIVRTELEPLGHDEACDYLMHHLRLAGDTNLAVFDEAAIEVLARGTRGLPRLLNQAAHQAFLLAEAAELKCVDAEASLEALTLLGLACDDEEAEATGPQPGAELRGDGEGPPALQIHPVRRSA